MFIEKKRVREMMEVHRVRNRAIGGGRTGSKGVKEDRRRKRDEKTRGHRREKNG